MAQSIYKSPRPLTNTYMAVLACVANELIGHFHVDMLAKTRIIKTLLLSLGLLEHLTRLKRLSAQKSQLLVDRNGLYLACHVLHLVLNRALLRNLSIGCLFRVDHFVAQSIGCDLLA